MSLDSLGLGLGLGYGLGWPYYGFSYGCPGYGYPGHAYGIVAPYGYPAGYAGYGCGCL